MFDSHLCSNGVILQMKKLRPRKVQWLAAGQAANLWELAWDPGSPDSTSVLLALPNNERKVVNSPIFWSKKFPLLKMWRSDCSSLFSLGALARNRTTHLFVPSFKFKTRFSSCSRNVWWSASYYVVFKKFIYTTSIQCLGYVSHC